MSPVVPQTARERKKTMDEETSPISKCSQVNLDTVREKHNQRKRVGERESERKPEEKRLRSG